MKARRVSGGDRRHDRPEVPGWHRVGAFFRGVSSWSPGPAATGLTGSASCTTPSQIAASVVATRRVPILAIGLRGLEPTATISRRYAAKPKSREFISSSVALLLPLCPLQDVGKWHVGKDAELSPILRHAQFEDLLNHTFADPVCSLLRAVRPHESLQCRVEINIAPASRRRCRTAREAVRLLDRSFSRAHHRLAAFFARNIVRGR